MQRTQDRYRTDRRSGKFGGHVRSNRRKAEHIDVEHFAAIPGGFEVQTRVVAETKGKRLPRDRLPHDISMPVQLIADRGSNKIRPVGVKPVSNTQLNDVATKKKKKKKKINCTCKTIINNYNKKVTKFTKVYHAGIMYGD